jgi:phage terminase small subunit
MKNLTPKQTRFVGEYLIDFNGAKAAIRAGYSEKAAKEVAYRLLTYAHVSNAIDRHVQETAAKLTITREAVLRGLLEAAAMAKEDGNAVGMVTAWREVAKLLGFYPASRVQIESKVTSDQEPSARHLARMTDEELLGIIKKEKVKEASGLYGYKRTKQHEGLAQ